MSVRRVERGSEGDECEGAMAALRQTEGQVVLPVADAKRVLDAISAMIGALEPLNLKGVPWARRQAVDAAHDKLTAAELIMLSACGGPIDETN